MSGITVWFAGYTRRSIYNLYLIGYYIPMNWVRVLRDEAGVTQQTLATRAGTSQPTIALYESGAKSPMLATLQRLASSLGLELNITFTPLQTREDLRSLAYHKAIAKLLRLDSASAISRARQTLRRTTHHHPSSKELFQRWNVWLRLPTEELISKILDPGMTARDMRQVTPFAGLLSPKERTRILNQFRKGYRS